MSIDWGVLKNGLPNLDAVPLLNAAIAKQQMGLEGALGQQRIASQNAANDINMLQANNQAAGIKVQQQAQARDAAIREQQLAAEVQARQQQQDQQRLQNTLEIQRMNTNMQDNIADRSLRAQNIASEINDRNDTLNLKRTELGLNQSAMQQQQGNDLLYKQAVQKGLANNDWSDAMKLDPERTVKLLGNNGMSMSTSLDKDGKPVTSFNTGGTGLAAVGNRLSGQGEVVGSSSNGGGGGNQGKAPPITPYGLVDKLNALKDTLEAVPDDAFGVKNYLGAGKRQEIMGTPAGKALAQMDVANQTLKQMQLQFNIGSISDSEQKINAAQMLDPTVSKETNRARLNGNLAFAKRVQAMQQFENQYQELMGPLANKADFEAARNRYIDENHIFNKDGSINEGNISNWQSYIPVNQQTINAKAQQALRAGADPKEVEAIRQKMLKSIGM